MTGDLGFAWAPSIAHDRSSLENSSKPDMGSTCMQIERQPTNKANLHIYRSTACIDVQQVNDKAVQANHHTCKASSHIDSICTLYIRCTAFPDTLQIQLRMHVMEVETSYIINYIHIYIYVFEGPIKN